MLVRALPSLCAKSTKPQRTLAVIIGLTLSSAACGSDGAVTADAALPDAATIDAPATITPAQRQAAAQQTAMSHADCSVLAPFYWEIGDKTGVQASGSTGDGTVVATTEFPIASASKWLFGAYVAEVRAGVLTPDDIQHLHMMAGYTNFDDGSCGAGIATVADCFAAGTNSTLNRADVGIFDYGGGHFQHWATVNGMGPLTRVTLAADMKAKLGTDIDLRYFSPQLAGGAGTSATEYAKFLRNILNNQLKISTLLGSNPVCADRNPATCVTPTPGEPFAGVHYSMAHWVEDDPAGGDGAFSSAGLFGFYPWINASKTHYGVLSRKAQTGGGGGPIGAGRPSMLCGRKLRLAFDSGIAQ